MIVGSEIRCNEIIRVLVVVDDVEEEMYAKVLRNTGESVCVTYLSATEKLYKGACVYQLESVAETVQYSALTEHHEGVVDLRELGLRMPARNCFVFENEIDEDESGSEILTDDDNGSDLEGFIDDGPMEGRIESPSGSRQIDEEWNKWHPSTEGGRSFKDTVDRLEEQARAEADEHNF